jgi:uncharacterized membrane protein affecting hemolysin expression
MDGEYDRKSYETLVAIANQLAAIREVLHALVLTHQGQATAASQHLQVSQQKGLP